MSHSDSPETCPLPHQRPWCCTGGRHRAKAREAPSPTPNFSLNGNTVPSPWLILHASSSLAKFCQFSKRKVFPSLFLPTPTMLPHLRQGSSHSPRPASASFQGTPGYMLPTPHTLLVYSLLRCSLNHVPVPTNPKESPLMATLYRHASSQHVKPHFPPAPGRTLHVGHWED